MSRLRVSDLADLIRARNEPSDADGRDLRQDRPAVGTIDSFRNQAAAQERSMLDGGFGRSQVAQDFVNRDTAAQDAAIAEQARRAEAQQQELDRLSWWERVKNFGARMGAGMNPDAQVSPAEIPIPDPQVEAARLMEEQRKEQVRRASPYYRDALIEIQAEDRLKRLDSQYQREADERLKGVGLPRIGLSPGQQPPTMGQAMAEEIAQRTREDRARQAGYQYETEVLAEDPFGRTQMRSGTPGESPQYPLLRDIGMGLRGTGGALGSAALRMFGQDDLANQAQAYIEGQRMRQEEERVRDRFPSMTRAAAGATESAATLLGASAVGGMPAVIATYGAEAFDQGLYDAKQAGLVGNDQLRYAAGEAAIASLVSPIMDQLGMSGVEKAAMAQRVANRTMRNAFGNLAKTEAGELGQELLELSLSSALQVETGVDPRALELSTFMPRVADTALATMMTVGAIESPNIAEAVDRFIREPSRKNYAGLPEEIRTPLGDTVKSAADRQKLAEQLIAKQVEGQRWSPPEPLETARNRSKPEEAFQPGVTSPPGPSAGSPQLPMGTPGVQPEYQGVPSQVPVSIPGEEVIVNEERMQRRPEGRQGEVVAPPAPDPTGQAGGIPVAAEPAAAPMSETEWRQFLETPQFMDWLRATARNNVAKGSPNRDYEADDLFQAMYAELLSNEKARLTFDPAKGNIYEWLGAILKNQAASVKRKAAKGPLPTDKAGEVESRYGNPAIEAQINERARAEGIDINVPEVPDVPQVGNTPPQPDPATRTEQQPNSQPPIKSGTAWTGSSGQVRVTSVKDGMVSFIPKGAGKAGQQTVSEGEFRAAFQAAARSGASQPEEPIGQNKSSAVVDTIAGPMDLTEFENKGYAPEKVTRQDWINLQRAERRRLGLPEESGPVAAPFSDSYYERYHEDSVRQAVARGDEVDPRVLADYPDLAPAESASAKEPWQMTQDEWDATGRVVDEKILSDLERRRPRLKRGQHGNRAAMSQHQNDLKAWNIEYRAAVKSQHERFVAQALREGKPVPPEVLADYPDLQKKYEPIRIDVTESPDLRLAGKQEAAKAARLKLAEQMKPGTRLKFKSSGIQVRVESVSQDGLISARYEDGNSISGLDPSDVEIVAPASPAMSFEQFADAMDMASDGGAANGAPVTFGDMRKRTGLSKSDFDATVLQFVNEGKLSLASRHDLKRNLTDQDRETYVMDEEGDYYTHASFTSAAREEIARKLRRPAQDASDGRDPVYSTAEEAPDLGVYRANGRYAARDAVQNTNPKGYGDSLFSTEEEARAEVERIQYWRQQKSETDKAIADREAKDAAEKAAREDVRGFGASYSPLQRGRAIAALNKMVRYRGVEGTIKSHIERLVEEGAETSTREEPKIQPMSRTQFNRATQKEQDEHQRRMDKAGTKTVYMVGDGDFGKTGYDYANYLMQERQPAASEIPAGQDDAALEEIMLAGFMEEFGEGSAPAATPMPPRGRKPKTDGGGKPESKSSKPKKPRSSIGQKTEKAAADAVEQMKKDMEEAARLARDLGLLSGAPINPAVVRAVVKALHSAVKAGAMTFADAIVMAAEQIGDASVRTLSRYFEVGWKALRRVPGMEGIDDAGSVAEVLDARIRPQSEPTADATTSKPGDVVRSRMRELSDAFAEHFDAGNGFDTIIDARKFASDLLGIPVPTGTIQAKLVEEAIETGVVLAARKIIENGRGKPPGDTYQALTDLYSRQPNLKTRVSESMIGQQYSTPVPLAYLASRLAGVETGRETVYEPTAGNGMLLIASDPDVANANELDPQRAASLKSQGFQVTERDATEYRPSGTVSAVIANPPFGAVRNEAGESQEWTVAGVTTREADHAIALRALDTLAKDGKAVLILGAKGHNASSDLDRRKAYLGKKAFYETLYREYPVTDHFTVAGNLYSRQGASFPVDVIVIDRGATGSISLPWAVAPTIYSSWSALGDAKLESNRGNAGASDDGGRSPDITQASDMGGVSTPSGDTTTEPGGQRGTGRAGQDISGPVDDASGTGSAVPSVDKPRSDAGVRGDARGERSGPRNVSDQRGSAIEGQRQPVASGRGANSEQLATGVSATDIANLNESLQVSYQPGSTLKAADTLVPSNQASALRAAIEDIEARRGDLTEFVGEQLGLSRSQMAKAFMAEQVDALAMAIDNHERGYGFIIGDQTGVGKGRVVAGMIHYARRNGFTPVFVTEKPDLFSNMIGDLIDIGVSLPESPFTPLILNNTSGKDSIELPDGRVVKNTPEQNLKELRQAVAALEAGNAFASDDQEYDGVFLTYSQMDTRGTEPERRSLVRRLLPKAFLILDESHNAGGSVQPGGWDRKKKDAPPNRAEFFREIVGNAANVFYSSATFAKRSSVMDLYSRTGMAQAVGGDVRKLTEAIEQGGVPLQQIVSQMLSESGQYVRREKSFDGIEIATKVVSADLRQADDIASIFGALREFDAALAPIIAQIESDLTAQGEIRAADSAVGDAAVTATSFSSLMHNAVDQMLFALKADQAADEAIAAVRRNEKPVIAVDLTMESMLKEYADENELATGSSVQLTMKHVLSRYLERSRRITTKQDRKSKEKEHRIITEQEMEGEALEIYNTIKARIGELNLDIPASPVDWIRYRIEQAGLSVREITGRDLTLTYTGPNDAVLSRKAQSESGVGGKQRTIEAFNSGTVDVVILNRSGSTGLSIHASEKFRDQRRRHMIVAQAAKNIDEFMQTLGRINRTGQVKNDKEGRTVLPRYTLLMTDSPAEKRPAALLAKKLSSLNASVTAKGKGVVGIESPDLINQVGGYVIAEYLQQDAALASTLDVNVPDDLDAALADDLETLARQATGRLAAMPVSVQKDFYDTVEAAFTDRIATLNAMNANPLIAQTIDLKAKTLEKFEVFKGESDAGPFGQPAYLERIRARVTVKPLSKKELTAAFRKFYDTDAVGDIASLQRRWMQTALDDLDARYDAAVSEVPTRYTSESSQSVAEHRLSVSREQLQGNIRRYPVGSVVNVMQNGEGIRGIVIDISAPPADSSGAMAPGRWKWKVAVNDAARVMTLSGYGLENKLAGTYGVDLSATMDDFETAQAATSEERWVATGNILAAYGAMGLKSGSVTFYTDESGATRSGVLMPRSFSAMQYLENRPVTFDSSENVREYFEAGGDVLSTPDAALHVRVAGRSFVFRAPVAASKGGKYTKNKAILKAAGGEQFVSRGRFMEMVVSGPTAKAVLDAVLNISPLQAVSPADREVARTVLGITKTGASISSPDDRDSGTQRPGGSSAVGMPAKSSKPVPAVPRDMPLSLPPAGDTGKPVAIRTIMNALEQAVSLLGNEVPLRVGKMSQRTALGIFKVHDEVARIREANDLETASHEMGHAIDKLINGWPKGGPWKKPRVQKLVQDELTALGRSLYGDTSPVGGYKREGWAEFSRLWLTDPASAAQFAPHTSEWYRDTFEKAYPKAAAALRNVQSMITRWREQGAKARQSTSIIDTGSVPQKVERVKKWAKHAVSMEAHIEMLEPLWVLAREAEKRTGRELPVTDDPYAIADALRMVHHARVETWVRHGMTDLAGNPTGIKPLSEVGKLIPEQERNDFLLYLWARRSQALILDPRGPRNPGMALNEAEYLISQLDNPRFREAAQIVYDWNEGVLDYAASASPVFADVVQRIRARDPGAYIPLARYFRELDEIYSRSGGGNDMMGTLMGKLRGSGREIKDPIPQMIANATKMTHAAHDRMILDAIQKLAANVQGLGKYIEKVPRDKVPAAAISVEELLRTLEKKLSEQDIDMTLTRYDEPVEKEDLQDLIGETVTFFTTAINPSGPYPIMPMYDATTKKIEWFYLDGNLYHALGAIEMAGLPMVGGFNLLAPLAAVNRLRKAGTVGLRASFQLFTNPVRDLQTLLQNTQSKASLPKVAWQYARQTLGAAWNMLPGTQPTSAMQFWRNAGGPVAQMLGEDTARTRELGSEVFGKKFSRRLLPSNWWSNVKDAYDIYKDIVQIPEATARATEVQLLMNEMGIKPGDRIALEQSLRLLTAGKKVTVDFSAAGEFARVWNQIAPFYNVAIQGPRSMVRAAQKNPFVFTVRLAQVAALSALLWWRNKDEEWYRKLSTRLKTMYWSFRYGDQVILLPKAFENGVGVAGFVESMLDQQYGQNPEAVTEWFHQFMETATPNYIPGVADEIYAQALNEDLFWKTPIESRDLQGMPRSERYNEYTSGVAKWLGRTMNWSPARIDHALRGVAGPMAGDVASAVDEIIGASTKRTREWEPSDLPVIGKAFQRGGIHGTRTNNIDKLYQRRAEMNLRSKSKENPETPMQRQQRLMLNDAAEAVSDIYQARRQMEKTEDRGKATDEADRIATDALKRLESGTLPPDRIAILVENAISEGKSEKAQQESREALLILKQSGLSAREITQAYTKKKRADKERVLPSNLNRLRLRLSRTSDE